MRMRFGVTYIIREYKKGNKVFMYEKVTSQFRAVEQAIGKSNVTGSEYIGDQYQSGDIVDGILHEDAMELSFKDETFDLLMSNDVFEHVPDYRRALIESSRVLKKGGKMFLSIPFDVNRDKTQLRAKVENGKLIYCQDPVYHGNPVSSDGSLVFHDFGWDFLDDVLECGYDDICMVLYYDVDNGYIGTGTYFFELTK